MTKRSLLQFSGYVATLAVFIIGITPSTFNIPFGLRPWIFLVSIVGLVVFFFRSG